MVLASCYVKWNRTTEYYTGWKGQLSRRRWRRVINQAIHGVDLLQWFAGMPVEVFAWTTQRVHPIESEDTAVAALKFAQRRVRHHRGQHRAVAAAVASHRDLRRERLGRHGRRRHRALGFSRRAARGREDPRRSRDQRDGLRRRESHGHQFRRPPAADPGFHRRHPRERGRSSSRAAKRARPSRWCARSTSRRSGASPSAPTVFNGDSPVS